MLGIIIGVGSIVSMVSVANGARDKLLRDVEAQGVNLIEIRGESRVKVRGISQRSVSRPTLTLTDCSAIARESKYVDKVSPKIERYVRLIYQNQNWFCLCEAGDENYFQIKSMKVAEGREISPSEVHSANAVCVIGQAVVDNLFPNEDPLEKTIRLNNIPFRVVGVLKVRGKGSWGDDLDDMVFIPYTTAMQKIYRHDNLRYMVASARSRNELEKAKNDITMILRQRNRVKEGEDDPFEISTQDDQIEHTNELTGMLSMILGAVASISLLVGGIGIMNIMLVTVSERIREIGIRMAIGARRKDILVQFVIESMVISILGGLIGVFLGFGVSWGISTLVKWNTLISIWSVVLSISFSMAVGFVFGLYPAFMASRLNPIDALRYE